MAFSGNPVVETITEGLVRISGDPFLGGGAVGTISLFGGGGDIELPDDFNPTPYSHVDLVDAVQVLIVPTSNATNINPPWVTKQGSPFLITIHNGDAESNSTTLEIYIRYH